MNETKLAIKDTEDAPWQAERKADPTASEHALGRAALAFAAADREVRKHDGPRQGREYDRKVRTWRETYAALLTTAASYEGDTANEPA